MYNNNTASCSDKPASFSGTCADYNGIKTYCEESGCGYNEGTDDCETLPAFTTCSDYTNYPDWCVTENCSL